METQSRVIATLNKLKEQHAQKQQKLGAVEDAVNEVRDNIATQISNIETLFSSVNNQTRSISVKIQEITMEAQEMVDNAISFLEEYEAEYYRLTEELDGLGVNYVPIDPSLKSDLDEAITYAQTIADISVY
jgi:DNA repair exonuclease SbcCD ATPase subunit